MKSIKIAYYLICALLILKIFHNAFLADQIYHSTDPGYIYLLGPTTN
jgi:hypothetical protein